MILVMSVLAFFFVPLAMYLIDGGIVEMDHVRLVETLQGSAEDGASSIDTTAYRQRGEVQLDANSARQVAAASLRASELPGLQDAAIDVKGNTVTVKANMRIDLLFVGQIAISDAESASFNYGP